MNNCVGDKLCVVADTCSLIKCIQNDNIFSLAKKFRTQNLQLILSDVVLREICKVLNHSKNYILEIIRKYFKDFTILYSNPTILLETKNLENKFYELHSGDSSILATAKLTSSILISEDRKLRRTADLCGVPIYNVRTFMRGF